MNRFAWVVAGVLLSGVVNATLIDFSTMSNQANYTGNGDFTVTTYGGPETDASVSPHIYGGRLVNSSDPAAPTNAYPTEDIIDFDFIGGVDAITVDMFWAGDPGHYGTGATVTSFDINGNVLEQFGYLGGYNAVYSFNSVDLIYSIQTNSNLTSTPNWWYGINSIEYTTPVPAPASLALLVLGLAGMRVAKSRKSA